MAFSSITALLRVKDVRMAVRDFNEPQIERRLRGAGSERTWVRSLMEVGATLAVLVLIMMGALAVRLLLSLPHGVVQ
jgi:hypothetical protein